MAIIFILLVTLPMHEWAHAWSAYKLGDPTAKNMGRLTLNPMSHIDYVGAFMLLFVGFGWAKPVPVNQRNFANPKRDMAICAAAGPASNFIFAYVLMLILNLTIFFTARFAITAIFTVWLVIFLYLAIQINIVLGLFNLIPFPPLDGSRILFAFLPNRLYYKAQQLERYSFFILPILIILGFTSGLIDLIIEPIRYFISFIAFGPLLAPGFIS